MKRYPESLNFLYRLQVYGIKLGLNNIRRLLELLGNPQEGMSFYHIAGTNGKGSVAAMLQALLRTTHERVGLYTSPHLEDFRERIRINDFFISPAAVVEGLKRIRRLLPRVAESPGCSHPTYFEVVTALACRYFREKEAEAVVWEVGMGGRFDATNIVRPVVSVITNISLEHTDYLGKTLKTIAREKAGIIKSRVPVITAETGSEALAIIRSACRRRRAPLTEVLSRYRGGVEKRGRSGQLLNLAGPLREYGKVFLPLWGDHQLTNCLTALAAWEAGDPAASTVPLPRIRSALRKVQWPGRFEIWKGRRRFILDGAHNPAGAGILADALDRFLRGKKPLLILGILDDKDASGICRLLVPRAKAVLTVTVKSERALSSSRLARICRSFSPSGAIPVIDRKSLESALEDCYYFASPSDWICVTGSLYLVGEARRLLNKLALRANL